MKTLTTLLCVLFLSNVFAQAQTTISYNFHDKKFNENPSDLNFNEGQEFQIQVSNINLYLYNVEVRTNSQTFKAEPSRLLMQLIGTLSKVVAEQGKVGAIVGLEGTTPPHKKKVTDFDNLIQYLIDRR